MSVIIKGKHFFDCQHCQRPQAVGVTDIFYFNDVYVCKYCKHGNYRDNVAPFSIYMKKIILDGKERKFVKEEVQS